jgi:hypothetical protein
MKRMKKIVTSSMNQTSWWTEPIVGTSLSQGQRMSNKSKQQRGENVFNFFVPATFEKGKKGTQEVTRVKGIASTVSAVDSDGETLFPDGFDVSPLLSSGFLNWDHQQKSRPAAIVGEPTEAKIINNGRDLYIEGFLYPDSEEAQQVAQLAKVLDRNSSTRKLGYSIEGQVLERASNDKKSPLYKQILKARITGVAITPCPKNPNTVLSLVKGEYNDLYVEDDAATCPKCDHDQLIDGKCLECGYIDEAKKAMTAEGTVDIRPESVEGVKYDLDKNSFTVTDKSPKVGRSIRKSEIYELIADNYTTDVVKAKQIYSLIESVNSKMFNMTNEISQEAIDQAFDFLNKSASADVVAAADVIIKGDNDGDDKGGASDDDEDDMEKAKQMCKGFLEQGMTKGQAIDEMVKGGVTLEVANSTAEQLAREFSNLKENGGQQTTVTPPPSTPTESLSKSEMTDLIKGLFETSQEATNELIKGLKDEISAPINESMDKKFEAVGKIFKGLMGQNTELKDQLEKSNTQYGILATKIEEIGRQSQGRKSAMNAATVEAQERFEKSQSSGGSVPEGAEVFNLRSATDRKDLADRIDAMIEKSRGLGRTPAAILEKAVAELEICKSLPAEILPTLKESNIFVVSK